MTKNRIDKRIEAAYYRTCNGIQINIMDIGKVFAEGKRLIESGITNDMVLGEELKKFVLSIAYK